ncbi:MAG: cob(I)yrinic acid a,c-diamide adenosyltransferase [Candidatus Cloacimonetes bacterium]|nr:cob(I)yrinic acid a,c-diamide adenosyltransferase [Candidatus Cloacimonadota bacterium]
MIQIYTGNGKGKTTAALGLIVRALGQGHKVCLVQFMKNNWDYGEIIFLSRQVNIDIFKYGSDHFVTKEHPAPEDITEAEAALQKAREVLVSGKYDLVVLDEINVAVYMKLIDLNRQLELLPLAKNAELVMTGRYAAKEVIAEADLVTEMQQIKHYFDKGTASRKGIEY